MHLSLLLEKKKKSTSGHTRTYQATGRLEPDLRGSTAFRCFPDVMVSTQLASPRGYQGHHPALQGPPLVSSDGEARTRASVLNQPLHGL